MTLTLQEGPEADNLGKTAEGLITSHVLGLWQEIVSPQSAAVAFARRDEYSLKLQSILYHHPAPGRRLTGQTAYN